MHTHFIGNNNQQIVQADIESIYIYIYGLKIAFKDETYCCQSVLTSVSIFAFTYTLYN